MKLKNAYETFEIEPWLRRILYRACQLADFHKWLERNVRSISFYPFASFDLNSTYNLQFFDLDLTGEQVRGIKFWIQYLIVYRDQYGNYDFEGVSDDVNGLPLKKRTTIAMAIKSFAERRAQNRTDFIAIVRSKILQSASSDFGTLESFDVFKFPEGWQPPA